MKAKLALEQAEIIDAIKQYVQGHGWNVGKIGGRLA